MLEQLRPGDGAVFGHVTHNDHGGAALLRKPHQRRRALAQLLHRARARIGTAGLHGLNGIDHQQFGATLLAQSENGFQRVIADQRQLWRAQAQASRALRGLLRGFLARGIEHRSGSTHSCGDLQQQRRLADARLAAQQADRTHAEPATKNTIELAHAQTQTHFESRIGLQRHGHCGGTGRGTTGRVRPHAYQARQRIPLAAMRALPLPFQRFATAGAAHVDRLISSHGLRACRSAIETPVRCRAYASRGVQKHRICDSKRA